MTTKRNSSKTLKPLFKHLSDYGLKINVLKCEFGKSELNFLGHHIDNNGIKPLKEKVSAISDYTMPILIKDLRRYLDMLNFYYRFLPNIAETIAPLYDIVKVYNHRRKNEQIKCKPGEILPFQQSKEALAHATLLNYPISGAKISLATDASDKAVGAVLQQENDKGELEPVVGTITENLIAISDKSITKNPIAITREKYW